MKSVRKVETSFNDSFSQMYNLDELSVKNVTFVVTEDCTLRCNYCYEVCKNNKNSMSKETGKKSIDRLFEEYENGSGYIKHNNSKAIILEFIGGEPLMEIELIDYMVEYFKYRAITEKHPWSLNYMISITSNGTLYETPAVQKFINHNKNNLSITITIDGNKELHDSCRLFPDGGGSYDIVEKAVINQLNNLGKASTKLTLAPSNIEYLVDAVKNLRRLGLAGAMTNCVFEEGWAIEDAKLLYAKMKELANYLLKDEAYADFYCTLFDEIIGLPIPPTDNKNWCGGTGLMLAFDSKGDIYPCLRYVPFTIANDREKFKIGTVEHGISFSNNEKQKVQLLDGITRETQSTTECFNCPIASGCAWCSAYNYDVFGTPDKRTTFTCEMHKARVMANVYFWNKYYRITSTPKRYANHIPKEWALNIISEDEFELLEKLAEIDYNKPDPSSREYRDPNPIVTENFFDVITIPYDKSTLDTLYDAYMTNLQGMVATGNFDIDMVSIKNLPHVDATDNWNTRGDKYVAVTIDDNEALGRSIIENGTYWTMITSYENDGTPWLKEGKHRYTALNKLIESGYIDDFKVPTLDVHDDVTEEMSYYIVNPKCVNAAYQKCYEKQYDYIMHYFEYEVVNDYLWKVKGSAAYIATMMIVVLLRNLMFDYSQQSGEFYRPRIELNDEAEMTKYFYPDRVKEE